MATNQLDPREIMRPIYEQIAREKASKTFVQLQIEEARKYGDDALIDWLEPEDLARHIHDTERGPDSDMAGLMCDALNEIDFKERVTLNKLVEALLLGKITVEQQQEFNALVANQMVKYGITVINQAIARAV